MLTSINDSLLNLLQSRLSPEQLLHRRPIQNQNREHPKHGPEGHRKAFHTGHYKAERVVLPAANASSGNLYMANCHLSSDWQFKQSVAVALPAVILKAGGLRGWAARFLPGRVAG